MANGRVIIVRNRKGKDVRLLNPAQKGNKYVQELKSGVHLTNFGSVKKNKSGKAKRLNDSAKAWRSGYLQARKDSAKAWKSNQRKRNNVVGYLPYYK